MLNVQKIEKDGKILAIIVRPSSSQKSLEFVTPSEFPLQIGFHKKEKDFFVEPHEHIPFKGIKELVVQEIFFIRKGKLSVGLYHKNKLCKRVIVAKGDIILINTGHHVMFLQKSEMIEIKQGPYRGRDYEKISFGK